MPDSATRSDKLRAAHDKLQSAVQEVVSPATNRAEGRPAAERTMFGQLHGAGTFLRITCRDSGGASLVRTQRPRLPRTYR